jgi:hypothetical protein
MLSRRLAAARLGRGGRASGSSRRRSGGRCCGGAAGPAWRRRSSGRRRSTLASALEQPSARSTLRLPQRTRTRRPPARDRPQPRSCIRGKQQSRCRYRVPWRLSHKPPTDPVRRSVMGRPMLKAAEDVPQVGGNPRQRDDSRCVSHQLGSKAFRTPLCNSLHASGHSDGHAAHQWRTPPFARCSEHREVRASDARSDEVQRCWGRSRPRPRSGAKRQRRRCRSAR